MIEEVILITEDIFESRSFQTWLQVWKITRGNFKNNTHVYAHPPEIDSIGFVWDPNIGKFKITSRESNIERGLRTLIK